MDTRQAALERRLVYDRSLATLLRAQDPGRSFLLIDENVWRLHKASFDGFPTYVVNAGEASKNPQDLIAIVEWLIRQRADRKSQLVGIGGGMVTDLGGFAAAIYMRGIRFIAAPTTLLGMVDAAIGGKNGINIGLHKNMIGTVVQPEEIWIDPAMLRTLTPAEWSSGMAEVIKYGYILDASLLDTLAGKTLSDLRTDAGLTQYLVRACAGLKTAVVAEDEHESGLRKILNFGHTAGHAFETLHHLPHGQAVSLGMQVACILSERYCGLPEDVRPQLAALCRRMQLPVRLRFHPEAVLDLLRSDKKKSGDSVDFILIPKPGEAIIRPTGFGEIAEALHTFHHEPPY